MLTTTETVVNGALPRTPGFSSGMGSHRSGRAAVVLRAIWRGIAVFGTARPQGKTFRRFAIVTKG